MKYDPNVYGYVNGKPDVQPRRVHLRPSAGFGPIENDADLLAFAEKVTSRWYNAGWQSDLCHLLPQRLRPERAGTQPDR